MKTVETDEKILKIEKNLYLMVKNTIINMKHKCSKGKAGGI